MKLLSASFFLAIGLGIGTLLSAVNAGAANGPRPVPAAQAVAYTQSMESGAHPDLEDSAR